VQKIGEEESPQRTSTSVGFMKLWTNGISDDSSKDEDKSEDEGIRGEQNSRALKLKLFMAA